MRSNSIRSQLFILAIFVIYPIASLLPIFYCLKSKKKYPLVFLSLFIGLLAFVFPPYSDLYRHYIIYINGLESAFKNDFIYGAFAFLFYKLKFSFEYVKFLWVFIGYCFILLQTQEVIEKFNSRHYIRLIILVLLAINFFMFVVGIRHIMSTLLFVYSIIGLLILKDNRYYVMMFISPFVHFSNWPFVFIFLAIRVFKLKISFNVFLILWVTIYILSEYLFVFIYTHLPLPADLLSHSETYVSGYWSSEISKETSFNGKMFWLFTGLIKYSVYSYLYMTRFIFNTYYRTLIYMSCLLVCLTHNMVVITGRYELVMVTLSIFEFISNYKYILKRQLIYRSFIIVLLLSLLLNIYAYRSIFIHGKMSSILYTSLPIILSQKYDQTWINQNLADDGNSFLVY